MTLAQEDKMLAAYPSPLDVLAHVRPFHHGPFL